MPKIKCKCDFCGKELELDSYRYKRSRRHFCSVECKNRGITYTKKDKTRTCLNCGKKFIYKQQNKNSKFCSQKCMGEFHKKRFIIKCDYCGKEFETIPSLIGRNENNYCSSKCKQKAQHLLMQGKNNPNYKDYLTEDDRIQGRFIKGYKNFIKQVYERDNYTCQCCGDKKGGNLVAHHLNSYNIDKSHRVDVNNGITLCEKCHKDFHKQYGYGNNTVEQFNEYLSKMKASK